ncbi:MAG TPA: DUF4232 domain-containing protein [Actinophytocola sp.]|nr:DUF4232 domain-containing protein [Actinophytocola sp.]
MARHDRLCVIAALVLTATSACGAGQNAASEPTPTLSPTTSTSSSPPPPTSGVAAPSGPVTNCTADLLTGSVETMGAAAGHRSVVLVVTNKSNRTCTIKGFGGLQLLTATREQIPTNAERNLDPVPTLIRLNPGGEAGKRLHWTVVATGDEPTTGPCQPVASAINVLPPDETAPFEVDYEFGSVCDHGKLETSAYYPH